jgi:hypothetical protein
VNNRVLMHQIRLGLTFAAAFAVAAFAPTATVRAQQPSPEMKAAAKSLAKVCRADFDKLCAGVLPGGGRVLVCLQSHVVELTPRCRDALPQAEALKEKAAAAGVLPK